ncbi:MULTISPECIES: helix-turn-helix transcriptional regulator [Actinoplanes]|uniref:helix-turn-helix domain-containing protein n=1 Tax=Actinoplanes TaxID=1865 RepID=UPI0005F2AD0A|nr:MULTISPECIES: helix-turn-helix transcriptional regulator [Actinoplanes]GLY04599.1 hypothetical protein Acsp01_49780 [Actinoplanes sp. NBRC 101535]
MAENEIALRSPATENALVEPRGGLLDRWRFPPSARDCRARDGLIQALVRVRRRRKMTQDRAAAALALSQSAVSELENGVTDARLSTLQTYARVLGCSLELILREGSTQHFTSWEHRTLPYKANSRTEVRRGDAAAWGFRVGPEIVTRAGVPVLLRADRTRVDDVQVGVATDDRFVRMMSEAVTAG